MRNNLGTLAHCDQINKRLIDTSTLVDKEDRSHDPVNNEKLDPIKSEKLNTSGILLSEEGCIQNRRSTRLTRGQKPLRFRGVMQ